MLWCWPMGNYLNSLNLFNSLRAVRRAWIPKGSLLELIFAWLRKRVDFWRSFSHSGLFLEPFLAHVWFIFRLFWLIFRSWAHFGSAGGQLFHHKNGLDHQRRPNRHFPQNIVNFWVPFWSHFSSIFRFLGLCF